MDHRFQSKSPFEWPGILKWFLFGIICSPSIWLVFKFKRPLRPSISCSSWKILYGLKLQGLFMYKICRFQELTVRKNQNFGFTSTVHLYAYHSKHVIQFILLNVVFVVVVIKLLFKTFMLALSFLFTL